jgi:hypothetical protein
MVASPTAVIAATARRSATAGETQLPPAVSTPDGLQSVGSKTSQARLSMWVRVPSALRTIASSPRMILRTEGLR